MTTIILYSQIMALLLKMKLWGGVKISESEISEMFIAVGGT